MKDRLDIRAPRIVFGNTINELMLAVPTVAHSESLFAASTRKLWLMDAGDMLVTPRLVSREYAEYVLEFLQLNLDQLELVTTSGAQTSFLANDIEESPRVFSVLSRFCESRHNPELLCYALDSPTLSLAMRLGIRPSGYSRIPDARVMQTIYQLNTKSGFRNVAQQLSLPIPEGESCAGMTELKATVLRLLRHNERVIIKLDRSSSAYAHTVVAREERLNGVVEFMERQREKCQNQPQRFVVETHLPVAASPSIELTVTEAGVDTNYFCVQRYRNQQFCGMVADPRQIPLDFLIAMKAAGERLGSYLHDNGYRGVFDLDAVLTTDGNLVFTETNVRRTAGTFVHELMSRLAGSNYSADRVWIADNITADAICGFDAGRSAIRAAGLEYNPKRRKGVLLTSDGICHDRKWRYLVVAESGTEGEEIETILVSTLRAAARRSTSNSASPGNHDQSTRSNI